MLVQLTTRIRSQSPAAMAVVQLVSAVSSYPDAAVSVGLHAEQILEALAGGNAE